MSCRQSVLLVAVVFFFVNQLHAHDLWLIPPEKASPKKPATIEASVGMDFPISVFAPDTDRYPRKFVIAPDGKTLPLKSAGKKDLLSFVEFEPTRPGVHVIAVETTPKVLELEADRFNEYLVTDGLPHIFRLRAKEKSLNQPSKERYQKSPKALLPVGGDITGPWDKALGLPLEIVPVQNPFERKAGDTCASACCSRRRRSPAQPRLAAARRRRHAHRLRSHRRQRRSSWIPTQTGLMTIRLTHMTRPKPRNTNGNRSGRPSHSGFPEQSHAV